MDESVFFCLKPCLTKDYWGKAKKKRVAKSEIKDLPSPFPLLLPRKRLVSQLLYVVVNFPRCFRGWSGPLQPANAHYFANLKSWMTSDVAKLYSHETLHKKWSFTLRISSGNWNFNFCAVKEAAIWAKKQILFLDNAMCHSESMID